MADNNQETPRKQAADLIGVSDDFVLPLAPPAAPSGHVPAAKRTVSTVSESSTNAAHDGAPPMSEQPVASEPSVEEPYSDSQVHVGTQISDTPKKSAPWSLVILLICLVIGLLIVIQAKSNEAPPQPTWSSSGINENDLASARNEAESMRNKAYQIEEKLSRLEQQQKTEKILYQARVEKLMGEKNALEKNLSNLIAETNRLKSQLQSAAPKQPHRPALPPALPPADPFIPNSNKLYRVIGLVEGDTLNVRSGPGSDNSPVIRLHNRVQFMVTGAAVANGVDLWLPCLIENKGTDPSTGLEKSFQFKGWVNSNFVEPVPDQ